MTATLYPTSRPNLASTLRATRAEEPRVAVSVPGWSRAAGAGWLPPAALALVAVIWGVTFTVADGAAAVLPPADLVAWRFGLGSVLLTMVTRSGPPMPARMRKRGFVLGGLLGSGFLLQSWALTYTNALTSGFLTSLLVVIAPIAGWLIFRERLGRTTCAGVALAATGVMVLSLHRTGLGPGELRPWPPLLFGVCT